MGKKFLFVIGLFFIPAFVFAGNLFINDNNAGNVGIGTSSTNYAKLNVKILANELEGIHINRSSGLTTPYSYFNIENESGSAVFKIDQSGNVGIGTSSPSKKLDIVGNGINLENTTFANQSGIIYKNGVPFIHNFSYGNNGIVTTEGRNLFLGENAGNFTMGYTADSSSESSYNTGIGYEVFYENTTGKYNTGIGSRSLKSNTTGYENTAIGNASLIYNTTGNYNTGIGAYSLVRNTTGNKNTAIGNASLRENITGYSNIGIGYQSLASNTTGSGNVGIGVDSLLYNTTANNNTGLGFQSLRKNTTGFQNTGVGMNSFYLNTTGSNNSGLGMGSIYSNTTGNYNSAVGAHALQYNISGSYNTAIGMSSQAGVSGDSVIGVTTVGYQSAYTNTANYIVAIGQEALKVNTGEYNTAIGYHSLITNSSGSRNTAIGYASLYTNTTGAYNTAIGTASLFSNTTGAYNTGIGIQAGRYITDGTTSNASSNNSIYLGYNTKALASGDTNEIVIGYEATGLGNNSVNLGNDDITLTALHGNIELDNNDWLRAKDYAGTGVVNMFKVNEDNEIDVGGTLNIGTLSLVEDSGAVTLVNMPVSSTPTAGDEMSYAFSLDSNVVAKVYAEADGSGGIQNERFNVNGDADITGDLNISDNANISGILKVGNFATNPLGSANVCNSNYMGGVIYNSTGDVMCYCMESSGTYTWKRFDGTTDCY